MFAAKTKEKENQIDYKRVIKQEKRMMECQSKVKDEIPRDRIEKCLTKAKRNGKLFWNDGLQTWLFYDLSSQTLTINKSLEQRCEVPRDTQQREGKRERKKEERKCNRIEENLGESTCKDPRG